MDPTTNQIPPTPDSVDPVTGMGAPQKPQNPKSESRAFVFVIIAVVIGLIAGGVYYFQNQSNTDDQGAAVGNNEQQPQANETSQLVANEALSKITYAFRDDSAQTPFDVFIRPATGGDREDLGFDISGDLSLFDRRGTAYAFVNGSQEVWTGSAGTAPVKIYTHQQSDTVINSIALSADGSAVAFSLVDSFKNNGLGFADPSILTIPFAGGQATNFVTADQDGGFAIYLQEFNSDSNQAFFLKGCYQCDGLTSDLYVSDGSTSTKLIGSGADVSGGSFDYSFNSDASKILYIEGTTYTNEQLTALGGEPINGIGLRAYAPYTLHLYDVSTNTAQSLLTFGDDVKGKDLATFSGWSNQDSQQPYYVVDNQLHLVNSNNTTSVMFETSNDAINQVLWLTDKEVLAVSQAESNNSVDGLLLTHFDVEAKKATNIMEPTFNTKYLGIE